MESSSFIIRGGLVLLLGMFTIIFNLWLLQGNRKDVYFARNIFVGRVYAFIPSGLMVISIGIALIFQIRQYPALLFSIFVGFGILAFAFSIIQPSFLKPKWLRWLEAEHSDMLDILMDEAAEMGLRRWDRTMKTQADLEAWVKKVRARYGR